LAVGLIALMQLVNSPQECQRRSNAAQFSAMRSCHLQLATAEKMTLLMLLINVVSLCLSIV
jgi:cell division protein FtsL